MKKICEYCRSPFKPDRKRARFCSKSCSVKARHPSLDDRIREASEGRGRDECWEWAGTRDRHGYGRFYQNGRGYFAHRLAYGREHPGTLKPKIKVLHKCDNPPCINPAHLFLGSQAENIADMVAKKRHQHGEEHYAAKLTEDDVREIWSRLKRGDRQVDIAGDFGVDQSLISHIKRRRSWKEVAF